MLSSWGWRKRQASRPQNEVEKFKKSFNKYKQESSKLKKSIKPKDKELASLAANLRKAIDDLQAARTKIVEMNAKLKKSQDQKNEANVTKDQALKQNALFQQNQAAELEKASDKGYNEEIIAATREMRNLKDIIY